MILACLRDVALWVLVRWEHKLDIPKWLWDENVERPAQKTAAACKSSRRGWKMILSIVTQQRQGAILQAALVEYGPFTLWGFSLAMLCWPYKMCNSHSCKLALLRQMLGQADHVATSPWCAWTRVWGVKSQVQNRVHAGLKCANTYYKASSSHALSIMIAQKCNGCQKNPHVSWCNCRL